MIAPIPLRYMGEGEFRAPTKFTEKLCDRELVIGEILRWEQSHDRSDTSHKHFFALVREAWQNLPENLVNEFPNSEVLRGFALIKTGHCTVNKIVAASNPEAVRLLTYLTSREGYSICEIVGNVVTIWEPHSMKYLAMKRKEFQQTKDDVLTFISQLIGTDVTTLKQAEAA
jgi:hypothetical protein